MKVGLVGKVLGHSWSSKIHEAFFKEMGITGSYELIEVPQDKIDHFFASAAQQFDGLNVTIPYKVKALHHMPAMSQAAQKIGAANTLVFTKGRKEAHNTDYLGFGRLLDHEGIHLSGKRIIILGTGGAARAVLQYVLDQAPKEIIIMARNMEKGKRELIDFLARAPEVTMMDYDHQRDLPFHDTIINTTPVGMRPHTGFSPVRPEVFAKTREAAVDIVYNPTETKFMHLAKRAGVPCCNGLYMLVAQAIASEEIWLDQKVDRSIVECIAARLEEELHG